MDRDLKNEAALEAAELSASMLAIKRFQRPLIEYLGTGLEDDDKWVRVMATLMLGTIGDSRSAEMVKPLLTDRDRDLRTAAARSLAMIRSPKGVFSLAQPDSCEDCMIRHIASEALEELRHRH